MDKPPPPESDASPFTPRGFAVFVLGLVAYALGFLLLSRDHPDLAPVIVVAGILGMVAPFLM